MTYEVKYRRPDGIIWNTIKNVEGDETNFDLRYRYFFLENGERIEIPLGFLFKFGKERFLIVKKNMEKQSGQPIITGKE
jgi:hypothetical protein